MRIDEDRLRELREYFGKLYGAMSPEERKTYNQRNRKYRESSRKARGYDRRPERLEKKRLYSCNRQRELKQVREYMKAHPELGG